MPIIQCPGYISKEEAAQQLGIKPRTINDWLNRHLAASKGVSFIRIDGFVFIKKPLHPPAPPQGFSFKALEQVRKFAERKKIYFERIYEEILYGNISSVMLGGRAFIINNEPALINFLKNHTKRRKT